MHNLTHRRFFQDNDDIFTYIMNLATFVRQRKSSMFGSDLVIFAFYSDLRKMVTYYIAQESPIPCFGIPQVSPIAKFTGYKRFAMKFRTSELRYICYAG